MQVCVKMSEGTDALEFVRVLKGMHAYLTMGHGQFEVRLNNV